VNAEVAERSSRKDRTKRGRTRWEIKNEVLKEAEGSVGGESAAAESDAENDSGENVAKEMHSEDDAGKRDANCEKNEREFETRVEVGEDERDG